MDSSTFLLFVLLAKCKVLSDILYIGSSTTSLVQREIQLLLRTRSFPLHVIRMMGRREAFCFSSFVWPSPPVQIHYAIQCSFFCRFSHDMRFLAHSHSFSHANALASTLFRCCDIVFRCFHMYHV